MNPVQILKHPWSATIALAFCMWAQIPHSRVVFEKLAKDQSGVAFAWGFEAAVLMFVVREMRVASWAFAVLSALMNVGYYSLQGKEMWVWLNGDNWLNWLLAVVLPFTIAMYSHVLAHVSEGVQLPALVHERVQRVRAWAVSWWQDEPAEPVVTVHAEREPVQPAGAVVDKRVRAVQLSGEGLKPADIAREVGAPYETVRSWLKREAKVSV